MKEAHKAQQKSQARTKRRARIRAKIWGTSDRPRLSVFRSNKNISAQLIDDSVGKTLFGMTDKKIQAQEVGDRVAKIAQAYALGKAVAEKARELNIESVVFDRGGYMYHGRVKAIADGARDGGLIF